MGHPTCLTDPSAIIVVDASAVINLNATGRARDIVAALPNRLIVVDVVCVELDQGRSRGRPDADLLDELVKSGLIEIAALGETALRYFEELVVGPAVSTLDDGEAATIAHAIDIGGIALVDERKATRLCGERYPDLRLGCTVDIFAHPTIVERLDEAALADAVFNALTYGRMRVFSQHVAWVLELIGPKRAADCRSLPRFVRQPSKQVPQAPS
jgi:predicted nucleic acid-binding protein